MHATIAWVGTSTLTAGNLTLAAGDVIAVLTGETNKANLSAMVDGPGTTITSTIAAGWTVWDSATGTADEWVLRAPTVDDATQYKYVKLRFWANTAYMYISHRCMESWDAGTNVGTNMCTEENVNTCRFPTNTYSNCTLDLMATARYIMHRTNLYSFTWGIACMEISRIHPSLEIGSGRVPAIHCAVLLFDSVGMTNHNASIPRILDDAGTADLTSLDIRCTNGGGRASTNITAEFDNFTAEVAYDNASNPSYGIQQIIFELRTSIGQVCGDSIVSEVYIAQGETVTGFEDKTTHTLDTADDMLCMWKDTSDIATHGNMRFFIKDE